MKSTLNIITLVLSILAVLMSLGGLLYSTRPIHHEPIVIEQERYEINEVLFVAQEGEEAEIKCFKVESPFVNSTIRGYLCQYPKQGEGK